MTGIKSGRFIFIGFTVALVRGERNLVSLRSALGGGEHLQDVVLVEFELLQVLAIRREM
jgi:hypothetical protein